MNLSEDHLWMSKALEQGRKGIGFTAPNPPVGAVIVKDGVQLASGWHVRAGEDHAERAALSQLNEGGAQGATIYVTLEPCSTTGKTGPCTKALIAAGVTRVVYGALDPNPSHAGRADRILQDAGIAVTSGILQEECEHLIRAFAMTQAEARPWVIAKTAMSLDGKITRPPDEEQWLSNPESREAVQMLRGEVDAILTSGRSVRRDDPLLNLRGAILQERSHQPKRVVLTRTGMDRSKYRIFDPKTGGDTFVFKNRSHRDVLTELWHDQKVQTVLLEAGGDLIGSFLDSGLVDELVIFLTPLVCGGPDLALGGQGIQDLVQRKSLQKVDIQRFGDDVMIRGLVIERESLIPSRCS